ncbi:hypothetical protein IFR05_004342 [Cadophora sp. M221]|nr:hypothetical protein IFR05_004342 [Cadophora sp. M221]
MIKDPSGRGGEDWGLGELGVYADKIANRLSAGHNGKFYNWNHDLTIAVETGKGYWHTAKSTAERVIRLRVQGKITGEEIKTLNEFVHKSVDVIKDVNQKMGWGNVLKEEQAAGILHRLGQVHNQMTLSEMGQFIKLMRKGDKAGMDKLVDSITARSDLEKERKMAELINKELAAKKEAEALKAAAQGVKELGKSGAANATKAAGKAGAGKLMMRGAGVALSLLQLSMAETTEEKIDATVGLVGNVMTEIPHPVVRAASGGIVVGQLIESFFHVSNYAAEAGMKVNVGMREMGFSETTSTVVGGIVTVISMPVAIPVAVTNRYLDIAGSALRRLF